MHRFCFPSLAALLLAAVPAFAQDLPSDPNLVQGQFANGLSYVVRKHDNPEGRFMAWIHIKAGALHETDPQNGVAHFLEHMAFNGSTNYPAGTLIPKLNDLGMQFGADSNAHTSIDETVYKLTMPGNSDEMLETAMTILGDFADGLLLADTEIDHERGVILEEKRTKKGAQERIFKQMRPWLFAGSTFELHDVIGSEEVITEAPRERFVDYWDTWYRPELITLIVVGDLDPEKVVAAAEKALGKFEGRAPAREYHGSGVKPTTEARAKVVTDPEVVMAQVQMVRFLEGREPARTVDEYLQRVKEGMGDAVLSQRLGDLVQKGEAPWMGAQAGVDSFADVRQVGVMGGGMPDKWQPIVEGLVTELKRALDHGFDADEIDRVYRGMISGAERGVQTESTTTSDRHVGRIQRAVARDAVMLSAEQRLELLGELADVTPEEVHEAFTAAVAGREFAYILVMPESSEAPTAEQVLKAAEAAWGRDTEAVHASTEQVSILAKLPEPGVEASRSTDEELQITTVEFENGLVMHHKRMDRPADSVTVNVTIPGGSLEEGEENHGVTGLIDLVGATSRMDALQIRDAMVGKKVSVGLGGGADALSLQISGAPEDLEDGFQLAYAMLLDGRIEGPAFDNWKESALQNIEQAKTDLQAHFREAMNKARMGDDPRFREMTVADVELRSIEEAEKWQRRIVDGAPLEVAVVGDLDLDRAVELVGLYFGSLPKNSRGFDCMDEACKVAIPTTAQRITVEVPTVTEKAMVFAGFRGCDADQIQERRALLLCASVLGDRMRVRIREEEGIVYSISCMSRPAGAIDGTGMVVAGAPTDPATADRLADTILEMMRDFAEKGPTADELRVAQAQANKDLEKALEQPGFWLGNLSGFRYQGRSLDELRNLENLYDQFTVEDLHKVAKQFFTEDREMRIIATPKAKG